MSNATVSIYEKVTDDYTFTGSGFFISDKLFVTAAHVIRDGGKFLYLNGAQLKFQLLYCCYIAQLLPGEDDLAICQGA
jgi:S1-C subfamily serine protease